MYHKKILQAPESEKKNLQAQDDIQDKLIKTKTKLQDKSGHKRQKRRQNRTPDIKNNLNPSERKALNELNLKGPASYGNPTR